MRRALCHLHLDHVGPACRNSREASVQYRPEIDGLRTIAVIPVILFHAGLEAFGGGFVGVDIFFVISGYLITSILVRELENGRFSIVGFYERRCRRILPAIIFVTLCTVPFAYWLLLPQDLNDYFESVFGISTFTSNFVFYNQADYFDADSNFKPMLHTWSLAVEEQYYILFPPFLALAWKWGRKAILPILIAGFLVSLGAAEYLARAHPSAVFYMLPTRAWELALGAIVAMAALEERVEGKKWATQAGGIAGLAMIVIPLFAISERDTFPVAMLLPTIGTALVIHYARAGTLVARLLSFRPMVGIGLLSYSAYLWHQPLFAFARHYNAFETPGWMFAVLAAMTFVLAWLSWRFVEAPFRDRRRIAARPVFLLSGAGLLALAAIGLAGPTLARNYPSPAVERSPRLLSYRYDNRALQDESWAILRRLSGDSRYGVAANAFDNSAWFDPQDKRRRILVVGNSHSKDMYNILANSAEVSRRFQIARYGSELDQLKGTALRSPNYREADIIVIATLHQPADLPVLEAVCDRILADGKMLVLVKDMFKFPEYRHRTLNEADKLVIAAVGRSERDGHAIANRVNRAYFHSLSATRQEPLRAAANTLIEQIATRRPGVIVVDRMDLVCDSRARKCHGVNDNLDKFFYDYGHHTLEGAEFFGQQIDRSGWLVDQLPDGR